MCGGLSSAPYWGPGPQPRHVPWLGIELATFWFTGLRSVHCTTPARPPTVLTYPTKFDGFLFGDTVDPANHFYYDTCITLALFLLVRCHILLYLFHYHLSHLRRLLPPPIPPPLHNPSVLILGFSLYVKAVPTYSFTKIKGFHKMIAIQK